MELRYLFKKNTNKPSIEPPEQDKKPQQAPSAPEGMLRRCDVCGGTLFTEEVIANNLICPDCGAYFRMDAMTRIKLITEPESFEAWDTDMPVFNPLGTPGYEDKLASSRKRTSLEEAVVTGKGMIGSEEAVICVMDCRFMMASMGSVVGEKITRAVEKATTLKLPVIIFCCSGGARMQEGIVSLMQMAKTSAALKKHSDAGLLYISVLTDPTTGGVTASFAMLGDIILAEPKALIGFAGPRVIEQTIGQKLPEGFQRSEFLLDHGFVDAIVERSTMKDTLEQILRLHTKCDPEPSHIELSKKTGKKAKLSPWDRVCISRQMERPVAPDFTSRLFKDCFELHGDRLSRDDKAIYGAIAMFEGRPVTVISQVKGRSTKDNVEHNFGMPSPAGYRKALRLMKQAEKFHRPIICFVDTPGAFCGISAEKNGQGEAIARNLYEMSALKTPILSIIIGEAGSGGALACAVSDEVWMLENAIYAILSPEGYASILWKDSKLASKAAAEMKLTADDMLEHGIVEKVIPEPSHGLSMETISEVIDILGADISLFLEEKCDLDSNELINKRYSRFRNM